MPGKKGGKKGGKKRKQMTEEERVLFMLQKAQAEKALAKLKEDLRMQLLKKEEQNSKANLYKVNRKWLSYMRQTRVAELQEDFKILRQTFERVLDLKNNAIRVLVRHLSEQEQQSTMARGAHLQKLDNLLEVQKKQLDAIEPHWNKGLKLISTEFNRTKLCMLHKQETEYLEAARLALERRYDEITTEAVLECRSIREDIELEQNKSKQAVECTAKELRQGYKQELQQYTEAIAEQEEKASGLPCYDQDLQMRQIMQIRHIKNLEETNDALETHLSSSQMESETHVSRIQAECEKVRQKLQQLRAELCTAQATERTRLANQTTYINETIKRLEDIMSKGERLLRLTEMCRKHEIEPKMVLPFYTLTLNAEEVSQDRARAMEAKSEELAQAMADSTDLKKFWQRHNKVQLECFCLERVKRGLELENEQLVRLILESHRNEEESKLKRMQENKEVRNKNILVRRMNAETPSSICSSQELKTIKENFIVLDRHSDHKPDVRAISQHKNC
ncbi:dynein regulatory complex subunit 2-like [Clarias gariepinus]